MKLLTLPFFTELESSERILIAGAGGGYDVFCGLPLFFGLKNAGKDVHLANLSFATLPDGIGRISESLVEIFFSSSAPAAYFPELHLCRWFKEHQEIRQSVYCFERTGVIQLRAAYQNIIERHKIDTIILVDGGTDSLMRGDEEGLGTPDEDAASLVAVRELPVPRKLLVCVGFGADHYHGVSHYRFLEAVAELTKAGAYLGMFSLTSGMPEVEMYRAASHYVFKAYPGAESIVTSSILASIAGEFGDVHSTSRTVGSLLWMNPLLSAYWCFSLAQVADRLLYADQLQATKSFEEVHRVIHDFRSKLSSIRPALPIPL